MGYPHRFFGDGTSIELDEGGTIPGRCLVEVTFRTLLEEFLMRPSKEVNEIILGCLGRAHDRYPRLELYVVDFLSDHGTFVCKPPDAFTLWSFMRDLLSTLANQLNHEHDREGKFWQRRYRAIPILDEASVEDRFAYCLLQGTKENLVWSARDWPGVSSVQHLMGGKKLVGRWRDRETEYERGRQRARKIARAAKRGRTLELPETAQEWIEYPIELTPLPHWAHLKPGQLRARVTAIVHADDEATRLRHERDGTQPLGVKAILATSPRQRARDPKKSPAPFCHTRSQTLRNGFRAAAGRFAESLRAAVARLEESLTNVGLLVGMTTPPLCRRPEVCSTAPPELPRQPGPARTSPS